MRQALRPPVAAGTPRMLYCAGTAGIGKQMLEDMKGRRALVTGASTGIGAAVAREFGRLGVAVAVHGNRSAAAARAVARDITEAGGKASVVLGDVR